MGLPRHNRAVPGNQCHRAEIVACVDSIGDETIGGSQTLNCDAVRCWLGTRQCFAGVRECGERERPARERLGTVTHELRIAALSHNS